ncbi:MAG: ATP-binding protein, partial [Lachnospiraceae bacterium]|nr:ATP-binding protein [Lachnospiraceae bacterium]
MNHIVPKLLIYGDMPRDSILMEMSGIFADFEAGAVPEDELVARIHRQIRRILEVGTDYGFDVNLWQNYLTFLLVTSENPFSITCEKVGASEGSVNYFAKGDFKAFKELFDYDFGVIEKKLHIDCFSRITHYHAISKKELMYNKNVSEKVQALSAALAETKDEEEFFDCVTGFYKDYGVGMFGLNKAFRIQSGDHDGDVTFLPINNMDKVMLDDLIGYELPKKKLVDNTRAFVEGRKCNNVLLYGDSGTGKSTSIKAIVKHFYPDGR